MTTHEMNLKFGRDKAGYTTKPHPKPKFGDLYLDGVKVQNNKPLALLQFEKQKLLRCGYTSKRVKVKYHEELRTRI